MIKHKIDAEHAEGYECILCIVIHEGGLELPTIQSVADEMKKHDGRRKGGHHK